MRNIRIGSGVPFFTICECCFWTASVINKRKNCLVLCPSCTSKRLEFIPLTSNESYTYSVSEKSGLELHFTLPHSQ